jgi:hypothetical protein
VIAALGLLTAACASLQNTPAQDLAWSRWSACRAQVTGVDIRIVELDGRISFWYNGTGDRQEMLACLERAGKGGPALPEPLSDVRPKGGA